MVPKVYFSPVASSQDDISQMALKLFQKLTEEEKIKLVNNLPIKVHVGESGNISYLRPKNLNPLINYLKGKRN